MKHLKPSTQYKKDIKKILNNPSKLEALRKILLKLENEQPIPSEYSPHLLAGDYRGCMECHIKGDFLLIWFDPNTDYIDLLRLGSHSELFGKGKKR